MNSYAPQTQTRYSICSLIVCTLLVTFSSPVDLQAQVVPKKSDPKPQKPIDPLTDPFGETQTNALPMTQRPATQQPTTQQPKKQIQRPVNPKAKKKVVVPDPELVLLDTKDRVRLSCVYFPPGKIEGSEKKPVIPFILLHEWDGDRRQLLEYASFLQYAGHAVIVPDLRGHGESTEVIGLNKPIDYTKFRKADVMTAKLDIERCKKFFVQQHNKGEVNVDLLCVVAIGQTCVLAVEWVWGDWFAFPARNSQGIKQGQDVKALMLISPVKKLAGVSMMKTLNHPMFSGPEPAMPMLVLWGKTEDTADESESIANQLQKNRFDASGIADPTERVKATTLFSVPIEKYKFSGLEMIEQQKVERFWPYISNLLFEQKVVANAASFPWESRELKDEDDDE